MPPRKPIEIMPSEKGYKESSKPTSKTRINNDIFIENDGRPEYEHDEIDLGTFIVPGEIPFDGKIIPLYSKAPYGFAKEIEEDLKDRKDDQSFQEAVWEASTWNFGEQNLVITCDGRFFGRAVVCRIEEKYAIRCMFLYCAGWRRREGLRKSLEGPRSAEIIWHFAARAAELLYGSRGRVFIVLPRDTVFGALHNQKALRWKLSEVIHGDLIRSVLDKDDKIPLLCPEKKKDLDKFWIGDHVAELNMRRLLLLGVD